MSLLLVGAVVIWRPVDRPPHAADRHRCDRLLIGFNLAPSAWNNVKQAPVTAVVTIVSILLTVLFKGIVGRLAILIGVLIGCHSRGARRGAVRQGDRRPLLGFRPTSTPGIWTSAYLGLFIPVVLVLVAENIATSNPSLR